MNRILSVTAIIAALGMAALFIEGCATNRVDLVDKGVVSVETVPSKRIGILWTDVYRQGDDSIIYGALQQRGQRMCPVKVQLGLKMVPFDRSCVQMIYMFRDVERVKDLIGNVSKYEFPMVLQKVLL